jgi:cell division protein FtsL
MEDFEEMKLYWNQLAEKNNVDSETNKKILESIMSNRYKSLTGKMTKERVIVMIVAAVFMIFLLLNQYRHILASGPFHEVTFRVVESLMTLAFFQTFWEILVINKFDFSTDVTVLRKRINSYKRYTSISYCIATAIVILLIGMMIYLGDIKFQYTAAKVTALIVFPIGVCFMYLAYLHEKKRIKAFEEIIDGQDSSN